MKTFSLMFLAIVFSAGESTTANDATEAFLQRPSTISAYYLLPSTKASLLDTLGFPDAVVVDFDRRGYAKDCIAVKLRDGIVSAPPVYCYNLNPEGTKLTWLRSLLVGQTTAAQVEERLGMPTKRVINAAGEEVWYFTLLVYDTLAEQCLDAGCS